MKPPRRYTIEAVVIRHREYGDTDRIVTLLTPTHGKVTAVAKGIRRSASRRAGHLDLFTRSSVLLAQGQDMDVVVQAAGLERFRLLDSDLRAYGDAHYVAELVDAFTVDRVANTRLYRLLVRTLGSMSEATSMHLRAFEMELLDETGYKPELHQCLECGRPMVEGTNHFSSALGGVVCETCWAPELKAQPISNDALKIMRNLQTDPARIVRLQSINSHLEREVRNLMREYIVHRLDHRLKSVSVMRSLTPPGGD
jgi:DNA repair protein RecO (recombination protein O)